MFYVIVTVKWNINGIVISVNIPFFYTHTKTKYKRRHHKHSVFASTIFVHLFVNIYGLRCGSHIYSLSLLLQWLAKCGLNISAFSISTKHFACNLKFYFQKSSSHASVKFFYRMASSFKVCYTISHVGLTTCTIIISFDYVTRRTLLSL